MKKNNNLMPTWLPVFSGFYDNFYWEEDLEGEVEHFKEQGYKGEQGFEGELWRFFDYDAWHKALCKQMCDSMEKMLSEFVHIIKFEKIKSPREYNFSSDSCHCIIAPKTKVIRDYIHANIEKYDKHLRDRYTSCDGFMSWYSNNYKGWQDYTNDFTDLSGGNGHHLGAILQFICENEGIDEATLYDEVRNSGSGIYECEFFKQELYDKISEIEKFAQENYTQPNRLELMYQNFDPKEFDFEVILRRIDKEIESQTIEIPFKYGKKK